MRALYIVILFLALLVLALGAAARAGPFVGLTSEARSLFARWMASHPKAREREQRCSGIRDLLKEPEKFFAVELQEPEHADVAEMVKSSGGLLDVAAMGRWIVENADEVHRRNSTACDT